MRGEVLLFQPYQHGGSQIVGMQEPAKKGWDFVTALLSPALVTALDRYIREETPGSSRSDALREAFTEWCIDRGYINRSNIDPDLS